MRAGVRVDVLNSASARVTGKPHVIGLGKDSTIRKLREKDCRFPEVAGRRDRCIVNVVFEVEKESPA